MGASDPCPKSGQKKGPILITQKSTKTPHILIRLKIVMFICQIQFKRLKTHLKNIRKKYFLKILKNFKKIKKVKKRPFWPKIEKSEIFQKFRKILKKSKK